MFMLVFWLLCEWFSLCKGYVLKFHTCIEGFAWASWTIWQDSSIQGFFFFLFILHSCAFLPYFILCSSLALFVIPIFNPLNNSASLQSPLSLPSPTSHLAEVWLSLLSVTFFWLNSHLWCNIWGEITIQVLPIKDDLGK